MASGEASGQAPGLAEGRANDKGGRMRTTDRAAAGPWAGRRGFERSMQRGARRRATRRRFALAGLALCLGLFPWRPPMAGGPPAEAAAPAVPSPGASAIAAPAIAAPGAQSAANATTEISVRSFGRAAPNLRFFGPEDGLSSQINDIALDSAGVLWVATADGLARYEGRGFTFLRRTPGAADGLPDNAVAGLHIDAQDRIWVATWSGLVRYDPAQRSFATLPAEPDAQDCGDAVIDMAGATVGPEGPSLWILGMDGRLCVLDPAGRVRKLSARDGEALVPDGFEPTSLVLENEGSALIGGVQGLLRVRVASDGLAHAERLLRANVSRLSRDADGIIWIGADNGVWRMEGGGLPRRVSIPLPGRGRHALITRLRSGELWTAQYDATYRLRGGSLDAVEALGGVYMMIEDREGGVWFLTFRRGLAYLPPDHARFSNVRLDGLDTLDTTVDHQGIVWLLGRDSLHRLGAIERDLPLWPDRGRRLDTLGVWHAAALVSCESALWIVDSLGVVRYEPASGAHRRVIERPRDTAAVPMSMLCDADGRMWLGLIGGGIDVHGRDGRLLRSFPPEQVYGSQAVTFVDPMLGPDGDVWTLALDAVLRWDGTRLQRLPLAEGEDAHAMAFAPDGTLWVARFGALERYRRDGNVLRRLRRIDGDDGLPALEVRGLIVSGDGLVWATTMRGLLQVDVRLGRARLYSMQDGLPGLDFTMNAPQRSRSGEGPAVALAAGGLVRFDPDTPLPAALPPSLHWNGLRLRRGEDEVDLDPKRPLRLLPGDRDLRVAVRLETFSDPARHGYAFRLEGYDPDWVLQDGERLANAGERVFSQLAPGQYVLDVRARNAAGAWSAPLRLPIEVLPPWWRTGWATALGMLGFAVAVLGLALAQRRRLLRRHSYQLARQRRDLAEEASLAKSRFLADLGHELRTPMTGVLGMAELLRHSSLDGTQRGRVDAIGRAGEHLLRLVDEALDLARIEAGRLHLRHERFSLRAVLAEVQALIAPQATAKGLAFALRTSPEVADARLGDAQRLRQVLLNLLGNAVKFTARGEVALEVVPARDPAPADALRLCVRDTGPGMTADQCARLFRRFEQAEGARTAARYGGTGLGLAISRELVHAMGGEIAVDSAPGVGTDFGVLLPLQTDSSEPGPPADAGIPSADDARVAHALVGHAVAGHAIAGHAIAEEILTADALVAEAGADASSAIEASAIEMSASEAPATAAPATRPTRRDARDAAATGIAGTDTVEARGGAGPAAERSAPALAVLLVEDDAVVAEVVAGLLHLRGHRVVHAAHGLAALMEAAGGAFDLALIDLELPGVDGCTLAAQLRVAGFDVPMLAITARADRDAEPQARAAGFDGFLRKPLSGERLAEAMAMVLASVPQAG